MKMKRLASFILAALLLIGTLPLGTVFAAPGLPVTINYGGDSYTLIQDIYIDSYFNATSYIVVAESGGSYYALGEDMSAVALTQSGGALTASSGIAVLVPETENSEGSRIIEASKIRLESGGYLHSDGDGYLSLVQNASDTACYWYLANYSDYRVFKVTIQNEEYWWNKYHGLSFTGTGFTVAGLRETVYVYQKNCTHAAAEHHDAVSATCLAEGSLEYSYCPTCFSYLDEYGSRTFTQSYGGINYTYTYQEDAFLVKPHGHRYVDGYCEYDPSHEARVYELVTSDDMIVAGDEYRYIIVRDDGAVFAIDPSSPYSDDWVAESGAIVRPDGKLILDDSAAPAGVYGAELVIEEFEAVDEWMTLPEDGTPLFTVSTETGYSLMPVYGMSLSYDPTGESKYPDGLSIDPTSHLVFRMWEYGDWADPIFYDAAESRYDNGDTRNLYLYRSTDVLDPVSVTGKCGDDLTWTQSGDTLTISGTGPMYDYENSFDDASLNAPWRSLDFGALNNIVIEEGVTSIGSYAFCFRGDIENVTLPDSLESIGNGAFWGSPFGALNTYDSGHYVGNSDNPYLALIWTDNNITSCTVHPDAKFIASSAFAYQSSLTEVSIPKTVIQIGASAFGGCESLADVYFGGAHSDWLRVTVEDGNDPLYSANLHFAPMPIQTGKCGDDLTWTLDNGVLTISGTGEMYDYENSFDDPALNAPWLASIDYTIKTIIIEEGVTYIGDFAFCFLGLVEEITLPDSLERVGKGAFWGCAGNYAEYDGAHYLGNEENPYLVLVYSDPELTSCAVNAATKIIGSYAFEAQTEMTYVAIPKTVTNIGYGAFSECDSLADVYYNGTEDDRAAIDIEDDNDALEGAEWHCALADNVKIYCDGRLICEAEPGSTVRLPVPETVIEDGCVKRFFTWDGGEVQISDYNENIRTSTHRTYTLTVPDTWFEIVGVEKKVELTSVYVYVGDVSGDGLVTLSDLQAMKKLLAGNPYSDSCTEAGDINFDGLTTLSDLAAIKKLLAGNYTPAG